MTDKFVELIEELIDAKIDRLRAERDEDGGLTEVMRIHEIKAEIRAYLHSPTSD